MMDITDRIVAMVFRAQGQMTMDELCRHGSERKVAEAIAGELEIELCRWSLELKAERSQSEEA